MLEDTQATRAAKADGGVEEVVVGAEAFKGTTPTSDFALYLQGACRSITNGHGRLAARDKLVTFTPECGGKTVIEIVPNRSIQGTMTVKVVGVGFTLFNDLQLFPFLREGERITLRICKADGSEIDMHARGEVYRAPEALQQIVGRIRCAIVNDLG